MKREIVDRKLSCQMEIEEKEQKHDVGTREQREERQETEGRGGCN